jgi:hypothetical protein
VVISKAQVDLMARQRNEFEISHIEEVIDDAIVSQYGARAIGGSLEKYPSPFVAKVLMEKYSSAGWALRFNDSQRDGASFSVS